MQAEGCEGDVIDLGDCQNVLLEDLGLFGCGFIGVNANQCQELDIRTCDIYSCSGIGINLSDVKDCKVTGCTTGIWDTPTQRPLLPSVPMAAKILSWKTPSSQVSTPMICCPYIRMPASAAAPSRITP